MARGVPGGFLLAIRDGLDEQLLEAQRGHARQFRRLETLAGFLKALGAHEFSVELDQWTQEGLGVR